MAYGDMIGWPGSLHDALDSFLIQDFTAPKAHFRLQSLRFIVSHELKDTGDENISGFGTRTSFRAGPEYLLRCSRPPKLFVSRTETFALSWQKSGRTCPILLAGVQNFRSAVSKMDVLETRFN